MMKVLGLTSQQEVYIGSSDRNFRISEFLVVEDRVHGDILGEVVEAKTYNRYLPLDFSGDFIDDDVLKSLSGLGFDVDEDTIFVARLRFFKEAMYPILTGSNVRLPDFEEVKKILLKTDPAKGLVLGVVKNTDDLYKQAEDKYKNLVKIFDDENIKKQNDLPYVFDYKGLHEYPHIGVFGGSGSGKSFGLRVLLEEIMKKKLPTVVLDPHFEMDFEDTTEDEISFDGLFKKLQIGNNVGIDFKTINSYDFKVLVGAIAPITESMENVVDLVFQNFMTEQSLSTLLGDLIEGLALGGEEAIKKKLNEEGLGAEEQQNWLRRLKVFNKYGKSLNINSVKGVMWRFNALRREGVFNNGIELLQEELKSGRVCVIQGSLRTIQVFSTYLLTTLYKKRRAYKDAQFRGEAEDFFPPFFIVTDEAHNFAPKGYESPSGRIIKEIAQEGRKYGVFLVLATQRPTLLNETVTAQLNSKFIFRTVRASDIDTIREETDLSSDEAKRLPYLSSGDVFISSSQLGRTSFVRIRAASTKSPHKDNPFDELEERLSQSNEEFYKIFKQYLPFNELRDGLMVAQRLSRGEETYSQEEILVKVKSLYEAGYIDKEENPIFGTSYKELD
ncbi:ATP-binding protein [Peptoniphilus sp. GNH]|nr:ATP-binding protein [Peptoniphilus sp. GNH]